ncbi:sulfite exporter TauE/SafE family protein [Orrella daihaiensis]|uniref:Probable membrane transporter protein n=1 Tax=Orrella daihaiensis TaxID=2782176 RepID=A0ABY4AM80_9BURK|nr:sulfite exporter TauE/SafE family protein [Orrella daihaiensis]UOD51279.1 sulfite exporter TauE/SafE family protein [Orrella daihaiensis]
MDLHIWLDAFRLQPDPVLCTALAIVAAFLMGFARSGIGAGGFVVSPLMVLALGSQVGIAVVAALMLPAALTSYQQHKHDAKPELLRPLVPAAFLGTVLGGIILWLLVSDGEMRVIERRLELTVAAMSLVYVVLVSLRDRVAKLFSNLGTPTPQSLFVMGTGLGISQTIANSGSPLMTVYFLCYRIGKEQFVGAQATFLVIQNTIKILPLIFLGILHLGNATAALLLMPLTFIGSWLGQRFYKRASEKTFFGLYVALLVVGFIASALLIIGRAQVFGLT